MASFLEASCSFEMACRSRSSGVPAAILILSNWAAACAESKARNNTRNDAGLRFIGHLRRGCEPNPISNSRRILSPNACQKQEWESPCQEANNHHRDTEVTSK